MSIIIGFVTKKCGIISSDGRLFGTASFDNGQIVEKAKIIKEDFDKTFSLMNGEIIGASAGITTFQGKHINDHLDEIIKDVWEDAIAPIENINKLINSFKIRLNNIDRLEISFEFRKVDIILILKYDLSFTIYAQRFYPNSSNDEILIESEKIPLCKKKQRVVYWKLFGDDSAQAAAIKYFNRLLNSTTNRIIPFLESTIKKSISAGIVKAGIHIHGDEPSCGGKVFSRILK